MAGLGQGWPLRGHVMHFIIKGLAYTVEISPRPIFHKGQPCKAKLDPHARKIIIADQLPREERRRELFHELRHAWIIAFGKAEGEEADADQAAEMMDELTSQYIQQGGPETLEALDPQKQKTVMLSRFLTGPMAAVNRECGSCRSPIAVGSVSIGPAEWNELAGAHLMDRGMCCTQCFKVTVWKELATADGAPLGALVAYPPPRVLKGDDARAWIAAHPELCEILV